MCDLTNDTTLGMHIDAARTRGFIDRKPALYAINRALSPTEAPRVLYLSGPGGVGKTSLLHHAERAGRAAGRPVIRIDGKTCENHPAHFSALVSEAAEDLGLAPSLGDAVLTIDTFERLATLETWLRTQFLRGLSARVSVIIAGRLPPSQEWALDPGWRDLLVRFEVDHFSREEASRFLTLRGIEDSHHEALFMATGGHPLMLGVTVDFQLNGATLRPRMDTGRSLEQTVVDQIFSGLPSESHRVALYLASLSRLTTIATLATGLPEAEARDAWVWLQSLSLCDRTPLGLEMHETVRDLISSGLLHADPARYWTLVEGLLKHEIKKGWVASEVHFLCRHHPGIAATVMPSGVAYQYPLATPSDHIDEVRAQILSSVGHRELEAFERWLTLGATLSVFATADGVLAAYAVHIDVAGLAPDAADFDPVFAHLSEVLSRAEPGRASLFWRFWGAIHGDQAPSPTLARVMGYMSDLIIASSASLNTAVCRDASLAADAPKAGITYEPARNLTLENTTYYFIYQSFADGSLEEQSLRQVQALVRQAKALTPTPDIGSPLSREAFGAALRRALKQLDRPDLLAESPLMSLPTVTADDPSSADVVATTRLANLLRAHIDKLSVSPRDAELFAVVTETFLKAPVKQIVLADRLGMSLATYRRRLNKALARLEKTLWSAAMEGSPPPDRSA